MREEAAGRAGGELAQAPARGAAPPACAGPPATPRRTHITCEQESSRVGYDCYFFV